MKSFIKNIAIPEFSSLVGKGFSRLLLVSFLFLIAIVASGIAESFDKILNEKMNSDPYIRCIDIERKSFPIPGKNLFDEKAAKTFFTFYKDSFNIEKYETASLVYEKFIVNEKEKQLKGMVLEENNEFYKDFSSRNQFLTRNRFQDNSMSLIVSIKFLKQFGYIDNEDDINKAIDKLKSYPFIIIKKYNSNIPIPVSGVVNTLNYNCSFAITKSLRNADRQYFNLNRFKDRSIFFISDSFDKKKIPVDFKKIETAGKSVADVCFVNGELYSTNDTLTNYSDDFIKVFDVLFDTDLDRMNLQSDFISFFLNPTGFSTINQLSDKLFANYGIEFENSRIETKNNYEIFQKILKFLSFLLVIFSCFAIIMFASNTVVSHLDSNKKSLGTLKAFGLTNFSIVMLYSSISLLMISISFFIAYFFSGQFGDIILNNILLFIPGDLSGYFVYADNLFLLFMILVPVIWILIKIFIYLNNKTPGDLIYERK